MQKKVFSNWVNWKNRNDLSENYFPGIYCIAKSVDDLSNQIFNWNSAIVYIGMSNAKGGIKNRLNQFDNTIKGKSGHGGADRMRFKYENYNELTNQLYVAICPFQCDVNLLCPKDLRIMGMVASFEYECLANYLEEFGFLPEFNDQKRSPKFSLKKY